MNRFLCLLAVLGLTTLAHGQELVFQKGGREVKRLSLAQLKKRFPTRTLALKNEKMTLQAFSAQAVLKSVYGSPLPSGSDFFFVCRDGYRSPVPPRELAKYPAYLAYAYTNGKPFRHPQEKKELGPFYLVWDSNRFPERTLKGSWPFQVKAVDQQSLGQLYSRVLPPPRSSPQVLHGFATFRKYCITCHQVNGQGGEMAIDLNAPLSVTEYIREPVLSQIIDNPRKVRNRATMPAFAPGLPQREQAIRNIIAYLKAKAAQRRKLKSGA